MKSLLLQIGLILFLLVALNGCSSSDLTKITIYNAEGTHELFVEVAGTREEMIAGLMDRSSIPEDGGMLFPYSEEREIAFWMKDMLIPIDIIFIDGNKKVNFVFANVPPCDEEEDKDCPQYHAQTPAQYVLEVSSGYTTKNRVRIGDQVEFNLTR